MSKTELKSPEQIDIMARKCASEILCVPPKDILSDDTIIYGFKKGFAAASQFSLEEGKQGGGEKEGDVIARLRGCLMPFVNLVSLIRDDEVDLFLADVDRYAEPCNTAHLENLLTEAASELHSLREQIASMEKGAEQWRATAKYYEEENERLKAVIQELKEENSDLKPIR